MLGGTEVEDGDVDKDAETDQDEVEEEAKEAGRVENNCSKVRSESIKHVNVRNESSLIIILQLFNKT